MNITRTLISAVFSFSVLAASAQTAESFIHPEQGTWTSTLSGRDVDQDGFMDYIYDSQQDVSWYVGFGADILSSSATDIPSQIDNINRMNNFLPVPVFMADMNGTNGMIDTLFSQTLGNTFTADHPVNYGLFSPLFSAMINTSPALNMSDTFLGSSSGTFSGTLALNVRTGQYLTDSNPDDVVFVLEYSKGDPYKAFAMANPYSGLGGGVTAPVPEPSALALAMTGLLTASLVAYRRRSSKTQR